MKYKLINEFHGRHKISSRKSGQKSFLLLSYYAIDNKFGTNIWSLANKYAGRIEVNDFVDGMNEINQRVHNHMENDAEKL